MGERRHADSERVVVDENADELGTSVGLEGTLVVVEDAESAEPMPLLQGDLMRRGQEAVRGCEVAQLGNCTGAGTCTKRKSTCSRERTSCPSPLETTIRHEKIVWDTLEWTHRRDRALGSLRPAAQSP